MFCRSARQFINKQLDLEVALYQVRLELVEINVQSSIKPGGNIVQMKQEGDATYLREAVMEEMIWAISLLRLV